MKRINIEAIRQLIQQRIQECAEECRDEPVNSHISSLASGEIIGLRFCLNLLNGEDR